MKEVVQTVLDGAETWGLNGREEKTLNLMEMKCLRSKCGVTEIGSGIKRLEE